MAEANRLGMRVLVTDHHLPAERLPEAACIVNPNQPGCAFPSKHLAGVGVMFYVLLALRAELRRRGAFSGSSGAATSRALLDLVALGTVADVVRLDDNNRVLVQQGLAAHPRRPRPARDRGAAAGGRARSGARLHLRSRLRRRAAPERRRPPHRHVARHRMPAGRGPGAREQLAQQLDELNRERRDIESDMQDSALAHLETSIRARPAACRCTTRPGTRA